MKISLFHLRRCFKRNAIFLSVQNFQDFYHSFRFRPMEGSHKEAEKNDESMVEEINHVDNPPNVEETENFSHGDSKDVEMCPENQMPSQKQEVEIMKKKYGGLLPRKPPLISKDNERAFFDSADWALGKVGSQKSKGPLEALLRPKLHPSPHQHTRSKSASGLANDGEGENQDGVLDSNIESHHHSPDNQNLQN